MKPRHSAARSLGQATMCYLPGMETMERECWYINMGAVNKSFFTTDALVRAAQ